jgi:probable rRNA maturation factor
MLIDIDIAVRYGAWVAALPNIETLTKKAVIQIIMGLDGPKSGELSIALVNDAEIQALNRDYRGKDRPTNVLSFHNDGPAPLLGDIVLAFETVQREAADKFVSIEDHTAHLIIHGFLHLQGYDHATDEKAAEMEALEIAALAALNIDNPYEIQDE